MRLKDYLLDRVLQIVFYYISITLVIIIMALDLIIRNEQLNFKNIIYAFIMSTILLAVLIAIDYFKKREAYKAMNTGLNEEDNFDYIFNIPDNINREHTAIKRLLTKNYMYYENTLDKCKENFKTQMNLKSRWIHQMKTPVSVIKLILENEKDKNIDNSTIKSYESIEEEIEKLSHGLEMELYSLKINDFEMDFKVDDVDVLDIVRTVINENKNALIVNSIYPKIKLEESILVDSDKKWLKFIISQIISNSIKYTKVKDIENRHIYINLHRENHKTILSIEDNGVGIADKDMSRIFNPFFTGENGRRYSESTGMGLYLAKEICDRLGHNIEIESTENRGTKVNIIFYDGKSIYNLK